MHAHAHLTEESEGGGRNNGEVLERREAGLRRKPIHERKWYLEVSWQECFIHLVGWLVV